MKIFGLNFGRKALLNGRNWKGDSEFNSWRGAGVPTGRKYQGWSYATIDAIAESVSSVPLKLRRKVGDDYVDVSNHLLLDVLGTVKTYDETMLSRERFINQLATSMLLYGEAYMEVDYGESGSKPEGIRALELCNVYRVIEDNVLVRKVREIYYRGYPLTMDNVVRIINPDPDDLTRGYGLIHGLKDVVESQLRLASRERGAFKSPVPSGFLKTKEKVELEDAERIRDVWHDTYRRDSEDTDGRVAVLSDGFEFQQTSSSLKDLEFIPLKERNSKDIMGVSRVSPTMLGMESSNRMAAEADEYVFTKNRTLPVLKMIIEALNMQFKPHFSDGDSLEIYFDNPVPADKKAEEEELKGSVNTYRTINEVREAKGMTPIPGGEKLYQHAGLVPIDMLSDLNTRTGPELDDGTD